MLAFPAIAAGRSYAVDPARTQVQFTIDATVFAATSGAMRVVEGRLDLDSDRPEQARITLSLDPASIDTGFAARDEFIRGASLLDTATYPELVFTTSAVYPDKGDRAMVLGELEMHGIKKPVTVETVLAQAPTADGPIRFTGSTRLSRSEWGMGAFAAMVSDDVRISFQLTAVPSP